MLSSEDIYEPPRPLKAPSITCDDIELFAGADLFASADIICDDIDLGEKLASDGVYAAGDPINLRDPWGLETNEGEDVGTCGKPDAPADCPVVPDPTPSPSPPWPPGPPEPPADKSLAHTVTEFLDWLFSGDCDEQCQERRARANDRMAAAQDKAWESYEDPSGGRSPYDPGPAGPPGQTTNRFDLNPSNKRTKTGSFLSWFADQLDTQDGGAPQNPNAQGETSWPYGSPRSDATLFFRADADITTRAHEAMHLFQRFQFGDLFDRLLERVVSPDDYVLLATRREAEAQWVGEYVSVKSFGCGAFRTTTTS